jgi:hypothetical protein
MRGGYCKIFSILFLLLCIITTVNAEGTSTILDNDQTTQMSGSALVLISVGIIIFAALIVIKLLTMNKGG